MKDPYHAPIEQETLSNTDFRRVVWTGEHLQVVLMSIAAGEDIGVETHPHVDQFFRIEKGEGRAVINGAEYSLADGTALVVPAGEEHNIINTGDVPLLLYTVYAPPNHIDGRVHHTKADALADEADEAAGPQ
ncbi:MAG TPA: cupin domain-containing protein [Candidatus Paceibacterota bacterium]|nr:cupin domain-containing protein [Candidatus Paceibacterota bacterium]